VSSADQKSDLDRQVIRLVEFANDNGLQVDLTVVEIGSGLNGHRKKLAKLLMDSDVSVIVVEHRDRLARFGFEHLVNALASAGRKILVADKEEMKDDLVQDMLDVLTSFCARLYGRRGAKNKAQKALAAIEK
jgi:predicted site-specific integrase-resolvase